MEDPIKAVTRHAVAPFRVAVVKWDRFSSETISRLAKARIENAEVAMFHNASDALGYLRRAPVDVGIFGLTLPDMDGLDLLAAVAREGLARRRLVVTWRTDERVRHVLGRVDIHALVETISQGPERLSDVLNRLATDGRHSLFRGSKRLAPDDRLPLLDQILSNRELQVLAVLADGSDDQSAAEVLDLSPKTIHTHRQRIMRKLEVQTRSALICEAMRRGVIRFAESGALYPGLESALAVSKGRLTRENAALPKSAGPRTND